MEDAQETLFLLKKEEYAGNRVFPMTIAEEFVKGVFVMTFVDFPALIQVRSFLKVTRLKPFQLNSYLCFPFARILKMQTIVFSHLCIKCLLNAYQSGKISQNLVIRQSRS